VSRIAAGSCPAVASRRARRFLGQVGRTALWAAAAAVLAVPLLSPGSPVSLVHVSLQQPAGMSISGRIDNLVPGVPAELQLTLRSEADAVTPVQTVTVRVTGASAGCPATALSVGSWSGELSVAPHAAVQVSVPVLLHRGVAGCAASTWRLAYTSA
jgi:hypothetical protein